MGKKSESRREKVLDFPTEATLGLLRRVEFNDIEPLKYKDKYSRTLKIHYGGALIHYPNTSYDGGSVRYVDYFDYRKISVEHLDHICGEIGIYGIKNYYRIDQFRQFRLCAHNTELGLLVDKSGVVLNIYISQPDKYSRKKIGKDNVVEKEQGGLLEVGLVEKEQEAVENAIQEDVQNTLQEDLTKGKTVEVEIQNSVQPDAENTLQEQKSTEQQQQQQEQQVPENVEEHQQQEENLPEHVDEVGVQKKPNQQENPESVDLVDANITFQQEDNERRKSRQDSDSDSDYEQEDSDYEQDDEAEEENEQGVLSSDDEKMWRPLSDEDDDVYPEFNVETIYNPTFQLKQVFNTRKQFREAVHSHAIMTMRNIKITSNDKRRVYARCMAEGCKWRINALRVKDEATYQIREYEDRHVCSIDSHCRNVKSRWLAKKYEDLFRLDPNRNVKGFRVEAVKEIKCHVSAHQAYRAKRKALEAIQGNPDDQFAQLWDYANELRERNAGSTVILKQSEEGSSTGQRKFDRFYVGFKALSQGFTAGCRPIIGVDGAHLRGPFEWVLMTAVAFDPNNQLYPIAYSLVQTESTDSWEWFLGLLKADLLIERDDCYTFLSDKQKGLLKAFERVFPGSDNRFCVRHLIGNMKQEGFKGKEFENAVWAAARATTIPEFEIKFKELLLINERLPAWFEERPPNQWCRAYFDPYPKCDALLNNVCESFNACILDARGKPVLTLLEWIRQYIMGRLSKNRDVARKRWKNFKVCPRIKKIIEKRMIEAASCIAIQANDWNFEVHSEHGQQYCVDLRNHSCTCRRWDISGIPCMHDMSAISYLVKAPEDFVDQAYTVETYLAVYNKALMPINGPVLWAKTNRVPPLPPTFMKKIGRPTKTRRKCPYEKDKKATKQRVKEKKRMGRQPMKMTCRLCGVQGHNKKTCLKRKASDEGGSRSQVPEAPSQEKSNGLQEVHVALEELQVHTAKKRKTSNDETSEMDAQLESQNSQNISKAKGKEKVVQPTDKGRQKAALKPPRPTQFNVAFRPPQGPPLGFQATPNMLQPRANIRGHAPTNYQPQPSSSGAQSFPVIMKDGKKFVTLTNLQAACTSSKKSKNSNPSVTK